MAQAYTLAESPQTLAAPFETKKKSRRSGFYTGPTRKMRAAARTEFNIERALEKGQQVQHGSTVSDGESEECTITVKCRQNDVVYHFVYTHAPLAHTHTCLPFLTDGQLFN